jgi:hypothetical protein
MRQAAVVLAVAVALAVAGRWTVSRASAQAQPAAVKAAEPNSEIQTAKRIKLAAAKTTYQLMVDMAEHGGGRGIPFDTDDHYAWSRRWMEAERDCAPGDAERRAAAAAHLERMRRLLDVALKRQEAGMISAADAAGTRYYTAEAEQWVAEAGR